MLHQQYLQDIHKIADRKGSPLLSAAFLPLTKQLFLVLEPAPMCLGLGSFLQVLYSRYFAEAETRENAESPPLVAAAAGSEGNGSKKPNVRSFLSVQALGKVPVVLRFPARPQSHPCSGNLFEEFTLKRGWILWWVVYDAQMENFHLFLIPGRSKLQLLEDLAAIDWN
ncbi:hypothetical protein OPV22_025400 [Ensete ventricosum]|uniref:Uncharacterized protein n=1 Tax=Ensete ventricosum TaxID=4639 RepID=A0AAV8QFG2_ENSVE|nr:hypothetical protein OPV22_025400 [Ensete ventricosum]